MTLTVPRFRSCAAALTFAILFSLAVKAQDAAKPTAVDPAGFLFIGISARTSNAVEMSGNGEIPKLWQRLFNEGILSAIPDRADDQIVAVYTDYASDANGEYTYLLGSKVKPGTKPPAGMAAVTVPAGKYLEFVTEKGPGARVVSAAWMQIYGYFGDPAHPKRLFETDYETYAAPSDPNAVQGHIFLGIKP
jgi:predicted transcriptional regulator YdeE